MKSVLKEVKYIFYIFLGISVTILSAIIPIYLISHIEFEYFTCILIFIFVNFILSKIFKFKIFEYFYLIPLLPLALFLRIGTYTIPISLILMNVFIFFGMPIIAVSYFSKAFEYYGNPINFDLKVYLSLLIIYIFYVTLNKVILLYLAKMSPARYKDSKKLKPYNIKEISEYLLSEDNLKILIYAFNFITIIFINVYKFQNYNFENILIKIEKPLLQSLVSFIAFDRVLQLLKGLNFKFSELYLKVKKGIDTKIEELNRL